MTEPWFAGAVHEAVSCASPEPSVGAAGAAGTPAIAVAVVHAPSPTPFVARTRSV